jgi:hypothetical protein
MDCGVYTPFETAFFYALPHARYPDKKVWRFDLPLGAGINTWSHIQWFKAL